jgi:hypothetical protein
MNETFKAEVRYKIRHKPRLIPVFTSSHSIPERVYEYNPRLFLCYNCVKERFEVHNLDQLESYCADLPYKALDARTVRWIWQNDLRMHGKEIFRQLERHEETMEKRKQREWHNWVEDVAKETRSMFAQDAWTEV